ncbi:MAG: hydrogenase nickel incorporation protein HypB, partial [Candidatus Eremiobacteraeota bacterium]|nr:hydrogenase nickel incorporation protein HypB [Candidatus Eremiobacteraeota bacterium]
HTHGDGPPHAHTHGEAHIHDHRHPHDHGHAHDHAPADKHAHDLDQDRHDRSPAQHYRPVQPKARKVKLEQDLLAKNQLLAERNRGWLAGRDILALNLMSSPGSGKTSLLERTLRDLKDRVAISVIEGDQATANDAHRIRATGCDVIQINTGAGCHLEAGMLARGLAQLDPPRGSVVMIENVGNLVCPALFDLGERAKVVILSVTEGEDKPIKYPHMFRASNLMIVNKIDLLPHVRFDVERCIAYARQVNPDLEVLRVSAESGEGMPAWYAWLQDRMTTTKRVADANAAARAMAV